jgi:hypothetical protein
LERVILDYELKYFESGEEKILPVKISFISRRVIKDYTDIINEGRRVQALASEKARLEKEIAWIATDHKKSIKDRRLAVKAPGEELIKVSAELQKIDPDAMAVNIIAILERIAEDNGINDERFTSDEWWEEHTEESVMWDFFNEAIFKDVPKDAGKKKVLMK